MALASHLTRALFMGLRLADVPGILEHFRFQTLRRRYYDQFWHRAAAEIGADIRKWDAGFLRLNRQGKSVIVRGPDVRLDDHLTLDLMGNKALTYDLMAEQGLAVPRHVRFSVTNMAPALAFLEEHGRPVVVKPNSGTGGGRGVTTGITSPGQLRRAAFWAARFDTDLLAETQVDGHSYRLLFLDGQFIDAIRRDPPRVTGNGTSTIAALVKAENTRRLEGRPFTALSPIRCDRDMANYLAAQGLSLRAVPAQGETVVLKRAANENSSDGNVVVGSEIHPATIAACSRLAVNLGIRLAGIDIIARDIRLPLGPANGLIGEINTTPGLHHHDLIASPRSTPSIAAQLLLHLFDTSSGIITLPEEARGTPRLRVAAG
jgi:cyanophycin synthetase